MHRGVRAVGIARLSTTGRYWAAHLAAGTDTALSDLSGGAFHNIHPWTGRVHLAAPTGRRDHSGVTVHELKGINSSMITIRRGLPVLKPAHVLLDLAARLDADALAIALNEALARRIVGLRDLDAVITGRPGHHGLRDLAAAVAALRDDPGRGRTHSELENLVLLKLRSVKNLPPFVRNQPLELASGRRAKADLFFAEQRVMVELDSRTWHEQRRAMDSDRRRDQQALAVGLVTFRVTWHHVVREWDDVLADLLALLTRP